MKKLKVSLIMPSLNEQDNVAVTFDAIFASSRLPDEIIVADASSTDDTRTRIGTYRDRGIALKIVENRGVLPGAGRNAAVAASTGEILMLLDFGNKPHRSWIGEMARPFEEDPTLDIVAGTFMPFVTTDFEHCVAAIHYHKNYVQDRFTVEQRLDMAPPKPTPGGLSVAYRRAAWDRAGGQPDWLRTCEDVLFSRKLVALGATLEEQPTARSYHHMRDSLRALYRQIFSYNRGNGRTRMLGDHFLKLLLVYGIFGFAGFGTYFVPWFGPVWVCTVLSYLYWAGIRKLIVTDGKLKGARYIWYATGIVVTRDVATLLGSVMGLADWLFVPRFRRLYAAYVAETDARNYSLIPNR